MAILPKKGFFDRNNDGEKSSFSFKETEIAKGFISLYEDVTGVSIDGESPDGTVGTGKEGNQLGGDAEETSQGTNTQTEGSTKEIDTSNSSKYYSEFHGSETYTATQGSKEGEAITVGPRPYSVFNKYSLVNYRGTPLLTTGNGYGEGDAIKYKRIDQQTLVNPTVSKIIEQTAAVDGNMGYRYQYSDFALTKYFGKIPNNMLITLRRFTFPCDDDIISPKGMNEGGTEMIEVGQPDIARAVTWLGEAPGNSMADILKFSNGFNWKKAEAEVQTLQGQSQASSGKFGNIVNSSKFLKPLANAGAGRDAVSANAREQNAGYDSFSNTYPNHVFGPLNVIKETMVREKGLNFSQEFTLNFEYELRSFPGTNPKLLMLDQLSNILALTYNNAPFWGGSVRYVGGGGVAKPLGDLQKLRSGDYGGFLGSVMKDMGDMFKGVADPSQWTKGGMKDNKLLNNIIGGGLMKMFNTPQGGQAAAALLSGDPTGQWHVTIGNPLNPIMVCGNLIMEDCEITFEGANAVQDFPEKMKVVVKLKPARPRDKAGIESMFNAGRGRFYVQPDDVADINKTVDVSAYGKATKGPQQKDNFVNKYRKISNG